MANGFNKAILIGNLGQDPRLRHTANGRAVLELRLATSATWRDKDGQKQERTEWHSVKIWGKRAEALNGILAKGMRVGVEGRIQTRQYEDARGDKRWFTEVVAQDLVLLGGGRSGPRRPPVDAYVDDVGVAADDIPF